MTGDLIKIDGNAIPSIVSYKVGRNKLWKDAERNMSGEVRATLIGVFPKIEIEVGVSSESEVTALIQLLDQAYFEVTYYDPGTGSTHTAAYYAADYSVEVLSKQKGKYKPFSVTLIPVEKRL